MDRVHPAGRRVRGREAVRVGEVDGEYAAAMGSVAFSTIGGDWSYFCGPPFMDSLYGKRVFVRMESSDGKKRHTGRSLYVQLRMGIKRYYSSQRSFGKWRRTCFQIDLFA